MGDVEIAGMDSPPLHVELAGASDEEGDGRNAVAPAEMARPRRRLVDRESGGRVPSILVC